MSPGFRAHVERERALGVRRASRSRRPHRSAVDADWLALLTVSVLTALLFAAVAGCPP